MSRSRVAHSLLTVLLTVSFHLLPTDVDAKRPTHLDDQEIELNAGLGEPPKDLDRSTPKRSWSAFLQHCAAKNWELAAHGLNLGRKNPQDHRVLGAATARKLCEVLAIIEHTPGDLDDTKLGPLVDDKPANFVVVAEIPDPAGKGEVWIRRIKDKKSGKEVWVVTRLTLSALIGWHKHLVKKEKVEEGVEKVNVELGKLPARFNASSPRAAAMTFHKLAKAGNHFDAARLLDLREYEGRQRKVGTRLARRLSIVLDRLHPGGFGRLNNDPLGSPEKDVPDNEEVMIRAKLPDGGAVQLHLSLIPRKLPDTPVWLISGHSVASIDALYDKVGYGWAGDMLPPVFFQVRFAKIQLWQWIGLLAGLLAALIFGYMLSFFTRRVLLRLAKMTKWAWDDEVVMATRGPLVLVFFALGLIIATNILALAGGPHSTMLRICKLLVVLGIGWFLIRTVDIAGVILNDFFKRREDEMGMAMVPVARRIFKPIMVLVVLIVALQNAGVNVAGLLAGLGIGGLALAMASKTTVENMLGGLTIAFDRPFTVGDFIKLGSISGSVEEVGLRSTRLRTLDRTVVTIPNGQVVDSEIENYAKRDRVRLVLTIGVQYDTTLDQMRYIIDEIKRALVSHQHVWQDSFRVRFSGFGDSALEIEILCYIDTSDFNEFTAVREEIFMRVSDIVANAGAEFAFPSRTVYTGKASDADSKKAKAAARVVEERTTAGELTIPEIPDELRDKLQRDASA